MRIYFIALLRSSASSKDHDGGAVVDVVVTSAAVAGENSVSNRESKHYCNPFECEDDDDDEEICLNESSSKEDDCQPNLYVLGRFLGLTYLLFTPP